jgi:CDP-diacylglycerol--glycerol-3-phosphate 3-phosphatidyltransferase
VTVVDLACSLALVASALVVAVAYAGRVSRAGPARHARIDRAGGSILLGKGLMEMGYWAMRPAARACIAVGLSANAVSWASLGLAAAAGVALATGHFGVGAVLSVISSVCDALDGMVARETGTASDAGEVLDAAIDRYAELLFLGGIAFHERQDAWTLVLALAATAGAIMVSYATAKAEAFRVQAPRGGMRRQERAVYLVVGAALVPVVASVAARWGLPAGYERAPLLVALGLVAVVGNVSAAHRLRAIARAVRGPLLTTTTASLQQETRGTRDESCPPEARVNPLKPVA